MNRIKYVCIVGMFMFVACQSKPDVQGEQTLFSHQVYFWLHHPDNPDDRAEFEKGLASLVQVPEILSYYIGVPAETGHRDVVDDSYTYSYLVFFHDHEAHDVYQEHPIHKQFVEDYQHLWGKVVVYDAITMP